MSADVVPSARIERSRIRAGSFRPGVSVLRDSWYREISLSAVRHVTEILSAVAWRPHVLINN